MQELNQSRDESPIRGRGELYALLMKQASTSLSSMAGNPFARRANQSETLKALRAELNLYSPPARRHFPARLAQLQEQTLAPSKQAAELRDQVAARRTELTKEKDGLEGELAAFTWRSRSDLVAPVLANLAAVCFLLSLLPEDVPHVSTVETLEKVRADEVGRLRVWIARLEQERVKLKGEVDEIEARGEGQALLAAPGHRLKLALADVLQATQEAQENLKLAGLR